MKHTANTLTVVISVVVPQADNEFCVAKKEPCV